MYPHPTRREIDPEKEDRYPAYWAPGMSDAHFNCFRDLAKTHAGIFLPGQKRAMVYRRVSKRLASLGLKDFGAYCNLLSGPGASTELPHFINALTTNKTAFFRENHHFEHLTSVMLPAVRQRTIKHVPTKLRIWSAGCSSGPEAYSIAMVLVETLTDLPRWDAKILATDIDTDMIEFGRSGVYSNAEMLAVPEKLRRKFVEPVPGEPDRGRLSNALRSLVTFNRLNLHAPWPMTGKFDAIFCRNVIIYFDVPDQRRLFGRFADLLCEGGHVYIGHSESLYKVTDRFRPMGQSIYQRIS
jgi:chemotaxis protein methyltransferase CheR